jgi:hypothetical protein
MGEEMEVKDAGADTYIIALSKESERISRTLRDIGYYVIGVNVKNACTACAGSKPDLNIWVRELRASDESSDIEAVKQDV